MNYLFTFFFFSLIIYFNSPIKSNPDSLTKIRAKYATCDSYQDSGTIEFEGTSLETGVTTKRIGEFETLFLRDSFFQFTFHQQDLTYPNIFYNLLIYKYADSTQATFILKREKRDVIIEKIDFELAVAKATASCFGIINYVPKLLIGDDLIGINFFEGKNFQTFEEILNDSFYTYCSTSIIDRNNYPKIPDEIIKELMEREIQSGIAIIEKNLRFDKENYALKRIESSSKSKTTRSKTIIKYNSLFDQLNEISHFKFEGFD